MRKTAETSIPTERKSSHSRGGENLTLNDIIVSFGKTAVSYPRLKALGFRG